MASQVLTIIDGDFYSEVRGVGLPPGASRVARAVAAQLNSDGSPDRALRAALGVCASPAELVAGLVEVVLAGNDAWSAARSG